MSSDYNQMCLCYDLFIASHTFHFFSNPIFLILKQDQTLKLQFDFKLVLIINDLII